MFTGIVQAVGKIVRLNPLEIECGKLELSDVAVGDSVCVQGVCLTVTALTPRGFSADVSAETLRVTAGFERPGAVNLEKSLVLGDKLGGHLVSGHVDGVGEVLSRSKGLLQVRVPRELARYIARKGSICIDGVSLTVNRVEDDRFEVNLIPHTLDATTLGRLAAGSKVNLEVDLIARYVDRMLSDSQRRT
jgi:riboflavin synthase